ncbi:hypothetical protein CHUAL_013870 [Chamberlinius hualienensis]
MAPMWFHQGSGKVLNQPYYLRSLVVADNVYLLSQIFNQHHHHKLVIAQLDFKSLKCVEFLSLNWDYGLGFASLFDYTENIIIFAPKYQHIPGKLLKIDTTKSFPEVEELVMDDPIDMFNAVGHNIIQDHIYLIYNISFIDNFLLLMVNLKTMKKTELIHSKNTTRIQSLKNFKTVTNGNDIYFFHTMKPEILVFNTVNYQWSETENSVAQLLNF